MHLNTFKKYAFAVVALAFLYSCKSNKQWEGQGEIAKVSTETVPVQRQYKGVFDIGNGIYASNDFEGARLNGISLTNDSLVATLITPENLPINMSPWYAFKLWSDTEKEISLKLTYNEGYHRYYPKISRDGEVWEELDSAKFQLNKRIVNGEEAFPSATLNLSLNQDTLWIAAQELVTNEDIIAWSNNLEAKPYITKKKIGESHQGRSINVLKIGESDDKAMIVVLSRQHPPEVTGFKGMQGFVETISSESEIATAFRKKFNTYVVPLVNPDGVANGHWRHGMGGIDLNRDWEDFNQPETRSIRDFITEKVGDSGGKIYFFVDFHSTWYDIYYTINPTLKGNMPGLIPDLIQKSANALRNYEPNVRPSPGTGKRITSTSYFFHTYGAESLTYEIGDNTPRSFIREKGEVTANILMELMLENK